MAAERENLDVRALDALGTPYGYDRDPRGLVRLRSQPGEWRKHPSNPVIRPGTEGTWDDAVISEVKVVYDGRLYHAWYAGRKRGPPGLKMPMDLGYATSSDGVRWLKSEANPVLVRGPIGGYDENMITAPHVLYDGDRSTMWYSAVDFQGNWSINLATSEDGVHWQKHAANPLLQETHDGRWDAVYLAEPNVIFDGNGYRMWYNGASATTETLLGSATSPDGIEWTRFEGDRPVLFPGPEGTWDDFAVARGSVIYDGELFKLWYEGHDGRTWRIGFATSSDGVEWDKFEGNPILDLGPEGAWDSRVASEPYVLFDGQTYRLWYSGYDGYWFCVGLATAPAVYVDRGVLTSAPFSSARPIAWGALAADLSLPEGTAVQFEVAAGDDGETWGEWALVGEVSADGLYGMDRAHSFDLTGLNLPPSRFLRYRATLTTRDPAVSPVLHAVSAAEVGPDFRFAVSQAGAPSEAGASPEGGVSLPVGGSVELILSVEPVRGFSAPVEWAVEGLPEGVSLVEEPRPLAPPETRAVVVRADARAQANAAPVTFRARSGDLEHRVTLVLRLVAAPTATPTVHATPTLPATFTPVATLAPAATFTPVLATATPFTLSLPVQTSMLPPASTRASASLWSLWPGIGLAAAGALLLLAWGIARWATRRRAAGEGRRPWFRHWAWAILAVLLLVAGLLWSGRFVAARRAEGRAYREGVPTAMPVAGVTPAAEAPTPAPETEAVALTEEEVRRELETRLVAPLRRTLAVHALDRALELDTATLDLETNLDEVVARAMAVEHKAEVQRILLQGPEQIDVLLSFTYTYNTDLLVPWVEALAAEIDRPAVEHAFDERTLALTRGEPGVHLDVEEAVRRLRAALEDRQVAEVELPVRRVEPRAWSDDELRVTLSRAAERWQQAPLPASSEPITLTFDAARWIGPDSPAVNWEPTRTMTATAYHPGRMGWALDIVAAHQLVREAMDGEGGAASGAVVALRVFTDVAPAPLTLADLKADLLEIGGRFDGLTGFYVQDLATGDEVRHNTYVTTSGMSMIKVAIMLTAYRSIPRPFEPSLQEAISDMIAYSINEQSNAVLLAIGEGDFQRGMQRVNETLRALGMDQSYIRGGYRAVDGLYYEPIAIPERRPVAVPEEEQIDVRPDTAMQTSLSDQVLLFEALYRCALDEGRLLEAYPELAPEDCQEMLELLETNPTRTLLGSGFPAEVPLAHKHGFGGGAYTDERMDVGIAWPPEGRPFLAGLYQWDDVDWIHWLRVWPMQIEFSTTLYNYFTTPPPLPAPTIPQ